MQGSFENAKVDDLMPEIRKLLAEQRDEIIVDDYYEPSGFRKIKRLKKGLFIKGITGSGKTHTLYAINSVLRTWGNSTGVVNWVKFLWEIRGNNYKKATEIIKNLCSNDFIFIDDLGSEQPSERNVEALYFIVDEVYIHKKTIFITTNLTDEEFTEKYGNRLLSRIGERCLIIEMPNEDKRIN